MISRASPEHTCHIVASNPVLRSGVVIVAALEPWDSSKARRIALFLCFIFYGTSHKWERVPHDSRFPIVFVLCQTIYY